LAENSSTRNHNAYVEGLIGSIRLDLLDHVVILSDRHLRRLLSDYLDYYPTWRTHQSFAGDTPDRRRARLVRPTQVAEFPALHGLHHYYLPNAA
jgi:putative transposase